MFGRLSAGCTNVHQPERERFMDFVRKVTGAHPGEAKLYYKKKLVKKENFNLK